MIQINSTLKHLTINRIRFSTLALGKRSRWLSSSATVNNEKYIIKSDIPTVDKVTGITIPELVWANLKKNDWDNCVAMVSIYANS